MRHTPVCTTRTLSLMPALVIAALYTQSALALNGSSPSTNFPMVGQIVGGVDGVLVAPNWVLTAGHAAASAKLFTSGYGQAMIDASFVLPGYQFPGNDLALLHLANPIITSQYTALNLDYLDHSNIDQIDSVTLANASSDGQGNNWQNRYVESDLVNALTWAGNYSVHWVVADKYINGNPLLQGGDSGSALFLNPANSAEPMLGGIASAICMTNKSCFVQPTAYRDWLDITLMLYKPSNSEELRRQQLNWVSLDSANLTATPISNALNQSEAYVTAVPEPGLMTLMLSGILVLGLQRRRSWA